MTCKNVEIKKVITTNQQRERIVLGNDGRFYKETVKQGVATFEEMNSDAVIQYKIIQDNNVS